MMTTDTKAFISYKSEYRDTATRVRDNLRGWGYGTWFDVDDITEGFFRDAIQAGLESASVVIGIVTREALKSREVLSEWNYAYTRDDKRLLLLRYQDIDLPYWLEPVQFFDCTTNEDAGFEQLKTALQSDEPTPFELRPTPEEIQRHQSTETITVYNPDAPKEENRAKMLYNVYQTWIVGALHANLTSGATNLGLGLQPDAVVHHSDYSDYTLPDSSRDIGQIFKDMNGQLLILGEPASGKTILLLQLAEKLLGQAQHDDKQPMPAVFNLSSWGKDQPPIEEWLVGQLKQSYGVPKETAQRWIDDGRLTLLLDGLDEIAPSTDFTPSHNQAHTTPDERAIEFRSACIEAINTYRETHPNIDIVVCSRNRDYDALTQKLDLSAGVMLHALTDDQIADYLSDDESTGIRDLLENEATAKTMAQSPFLLTMMKTAYASIPYIGSPHNQLKLEKLYPIKKMTSGSLLARIRRIQTIEIHRSNHLLEKYTAGQITGSNHPDYSNQQIRYWLSWLAWQMVKHKTSVFYIEDLQPTWATKQLQYNIVVRLSGGLPVGLIFALIFALSGGLSRGLIFPLLVGLIGALFGALFVGGEDIKFIEKLTWSFSKEILGGGLLGGLPFGLLVGLLFGLQYGLLSWLLLALLGGLIGGLIGGLRIQSNLDLRVKPNAGLLLSLKNSLRVGLFIGLLLALIGGLLVELILGLQYGLLVGLIVGLILGLQYGLILGGGSAVIKHMTLRLTLASEGVIPRWRYDAFLDHCAKLGLLRKVGGGYIFRHRLLLEYFAEQYAKQHTDSE